MNPTRDHWFALLVVEQEMVRIEDLAPVWHAWAAGSNDSLATCLVREQLINDVQCHSIDALVDRHQSRDGRPFPEGFLRALETADASATISGLLLPPLAPTLAGPVSSPVVIAATADVRYRRLHLHASGGLGQVWLAHDRQLERDVALKELRPEMRGDAELARRFVIEAKITGQLEHPGIVPIYELANEGISPTYAMRFLKGKTLTDAIRQAKTLSERLKLLPAFATVCQTIAYAHSRGYIHRDLKGANILLGDFGEVIVLDWGLAKHVDQGDASTTDAMPLKALVEGTQAGQALGTPFYMPPEQAAGQLDRIGFRSDVYSLGAILYEVIAGVPPFLTFLVDLECTMRRSRQSSDCSKRCEKPCSLRPCQVDRTLAALEADMSESNARSGRRYARRANLGRKLLDRRRSRKCPPGDP
ncbi:MAG: serine/threonine-protein kinase [Gemmataceae bacterium]